MPMAKHHSVTPQTFKARVKAVHGTAVRVLTPFENWITKVTFRCTPCKHEWQAKPQNVINGSGCPECAWARRRANSSKPRVAAKADSHAQQFKAQLRRFPSITCTSAPPQKLADKIDLHCKTCKTDWTTNWHSFKYTEKGCGHCTKSKATKGKAHARRSTDRFAAHIAKVTKTATKLLGEYNGPNADRHFECTACGHDWIVPGTKEIDAGLYCPHCKTAGFSKMALEWLESMERIFGKIQHARNGGEFCVPGTRFKCDGYIAKKRIVFEFYGDAYHGNLTTFKPLSRPHPFDKSVTAKTLNNRTMKREAALKALGYIVISVWESDFKRWRSRKSK